MTGGIDYDKQTMTYTELRQNVKPILFSTEMMEAILEGRKTVTRRAAFSNKVLREFHSEKYPEGWWLHGRVCKDWDAMLSALAKDGCKCKYRKGDILYVRETWCKYDDVIDGVKFAYKADATSVSEEARKDLGYKWKPSTCMPKEAARIFLRVIDVRVERLQDITTGDYRTACNIVAEGLHAPCRHCTDANRECNDLVHEQACKFVNCFIDLWNSTFIESDLELYGWAANPWVWVVEFERVEGVG